MPLAAGPVPLVSRAREFATGLPGSVGLEPILQPLGHVRMPDAPAGLAGGLTEPVRSYAGREPMVLARPRLPDRWRLRWPWASAGSEVASIETGGVPEGPARGEPAGEPAAPNPTTADEPPSATVAA